VTDLSLNDATSAGRVTFELVTCTGKAHLFVKPALLANNEPMDQMFETIPYGTSNEGHKTATWPFPDKSTGVKAQGIRNPVTHELDTTLPSIPFGKSGNQSSFDNAITFRIKHAEYFISVYMLEESTYTLTAYTHIGEVNPRQAIHSGMFAEMRRSLTPAWDKGVLTLKWHIHYNDSAPAMYDEDTYQLYMVEMPKDGQTVGAGICGQGVADLGPDSGDYYNWQSTPDVDETGNPSMPIGAISSTETTLSFETGRDVWEPLNHGEHLFSDAKLLLLLCTLTHRSLSSSSFDYSIFYFLQCLYIFYYLLYIRLPLAVLPTVALSSKCVIWSPCGLIKNGIMVNEEMKASEADMADHSMTVSRIWIWLTIR
jgi:hypothetical protein